MDNTVIVGIGSSAGGLRPMMKFFDHVPHDKGIYVITRHVPIDHRNQLHTILQLHSRLTIVEATHGMKTEKDFVYIPPSDMLITINDGRLFLEKRKPRSLVADSIDLFLASLANSKKKRSVALILSGTGSDGLEGAMAIKQAGGMVFAQNLASCEFDSMPRHVINAGLADHVLEPGDMPPVLLAHVSHLVKNDDLARNLLRP